MSVLNKPQTDGLESKERTTFLAMTQSIIKKFDSEIQNENRNKPKKLERIKDRSDVNIF